MKVLLWCYYLLCYFHRFTFITFTFIILIWSTLSWLYCMCFLLCLTLCLTLIFDSGVCILFKLHTFFTVCYALFTTPCRLVFLYCALFALCGTYTHVWKRRRDSFIQPPPLTFSYVNCAPSRNIDLRYNLYNLYRHIFRTRKEKMARFYFLRTIVNKYFILNVSSKSSILNPRSFK